MNSQTHNMLIALTNEEIDLVSAASSLPYNEFVPTQDDADFTEPQDRQRGRKRQRKTIAS